MIYKTWKEYTKFMKDMVILFFIGTAVFILLNGFLSNFLGLFSMMLAVIGLILGLTDYKKMKELKE